MYLAPQPNQVCGTWGPGAPVVGDPWGGQGQTWAGMVEGPGLVGTWVPGEDPHAQTSETPGRQQAGNPDRGVRRDLAWVEHHHAQR